MREKTLVDTQAHNKKQLFDAVAKQTNKKFNKTPKHHTEMW